ncbi:MAG: prepilin peptidase [Dehalococcoidia bacterium]
MLPAIWVTGAVLVGAAWGRILNGFMDWLPSGGGPLYRLFLCPRCSRTLPLGHLIPIVGAWWHHRGCSALAAYPLRAPLVEVLTALAFALVTWHLGVTPQAIVALAYLSILAIALVCDLEHTLIPNRLVYPALPLALALAPLGPPGSSSPGTGAFLNALAGAGGAMVVLLFLYVVTRGRLGAGDVKLATLVGAMLGFPQAITALGVAFVAGGMWALALLALRRKRIGDVIPYGPFLAGGAALALFQGHTILDAYLALLGMSG